MTDSTDPATSGPRPPGAQIAALERDVALANRAFSVSLHDASEAGLQAAARITRAIRPVLIVAAVLGGGVILVQLVRRARPVRAAAPASRRPLWAKLARSAASAIATAAARRLAARWMRQAPSRQPRLDA
jgi:hypothetical protein